MCQSHSLVDRINKKQRHAVRKRSGKSYPRYIRDQSVHVLIIQRTQDPFASIFFPDPAYQADVVIGGGTIEEIQET